MQSLADIYQRLVMTKRQRKDLMTSFKDALASNARYKEITDQIAELRLQKKAIENEVLSVEIDKARLEELKQDIKTDTEALADIALTMYVSGEPVEITDDTNTKWSPVFRVTFKKG